MITDTRIETYLAERGGLNRLRIHSVDVPGENFGAVAFDRVWLSHPHYFPISTDGYSFMHFFSVFAPRKYAQHFTEEMHAAILNGAALFDHSDCLSGAFVVGGVSNYFHWLVDFLPRLYLLSQDRSLVDRPVVINGDLAPFQVDALVMACKALGVCVPALVQAPGTDLFPLRDAVVCGRVHRGSAVRIWSQFLAPPRNVPADQRINLFVGRKDAAYRRLVNQPELADLLATLGFHEVEPGKLRYAEQVELFARARVVVGVHGAGLTNMLFAPSDATLVELWAGLQQPHYVDIARHRGIRYIDLEGETVSGEDRTQHRDFRIDPAVLRRTLAGLA